MIMTSTNTLRTRILRAQRLINSKSGNPRYLIHTTDGIWRTALDATVAFSIESAEYQDTDVIFSLDEDRRIIGIARADGAAAAGSQA
ncbi:hypothetical protein SEA_SKOG_132 [Gordonia phage Skog]|uniref:Uncharacterized protein n=1 Tax=Gordonia phage Skog TaxID=2704033 RepID=A0A6G6XJU4_9CAUD|nr:hypothetical protein KHQ85_gp132 [Gordonia phage Skog]QIG58284.1 hypothetical protein SEA_SKOG_132 [Gordonia phage Skog]